MTTHVTAASEFEGWAIVELMGHRRLAGYVADVEAFGGRMLRLDVPRDVGLDTEVGVPGEDDIAATQLYGVSAIYCVTPTTERIARANATMPRPVQPWELPEYPAGTTTGRLIGPPVEPTYGDGRDD